MKPKRTTHGLLLEKGYDSKIWDWINELEVRINGLGLQAYVEALKNIPFVGGSGLNVGWFKAIKSSDTEIKLIDGTDSDNTTDCGYAQVNNIYGTVEQLTETITATGLVYLQWEYDTVTETLGSPTLESGSITYADNFFKIPIAKITFTDSKISSIKQIWTGGFILGYTLGAC